MLHVRTYVSATSVLFALAVSTSALAQSPNAGSLVDSYARARRIVDDAVAAHGGTAALAEARQIHLSITGRDLWRNQSRRPEPPYDAEAIRIELRVDLAKNRLVRDQYSVFPGGIRRDSRAIVDSAGNYFVNLRTRTYSPWPPTPQPASRDPNLSFLPQFVVLNAVENAHTLRSLGEVQLSSGAVVNAISLTALGQSWTLWFDKNTKLLRGFGGVLRDVLTGDGSVEHEYLDYRTVNGILLPGRRITRVAGEVTRELNYMGAQLKYTIADSLARLPAGFVPDPQASNEPVKQLANGVFLVNSALAVEFKDHVVVVEPVGAEQNIARMATLFPNKPIRYVVTTHHHDDHAGGVKNYAAHGATLVTTAGNRVYLTKMATSRGTIGSYPPPLTAPPTIEVISGRRVFTDGTQTLEVHEIRGNPHADEMLVAWLPASGVLYQGDLIDNGSDGSLLPGTNNETTAHFGEWLKAKGWTVRTFTGTHGTLKSADVFQEILKQPFYTANP